MSMSIVALSPEVWVHFWEALLAAIALDLIKICFKWVWQFVQKRMKRPRNDPFQG